MPLLLRAYTTPANTIANPPGLPAVPVSSPFPVWPRINDNTLNGMPVSYLWNKDPLTQADVDTGQLVTFTTTLTLPWLKKEVKATIVVALFGDNAVRTTLAVNGNDVPFLVTNPLTNGGPVIVNGEDIGPPFFWANIAVGVAEVKLCEGINTIVLTSVAANYATPGGPVSTNPAGYLAEIDVVAQEKDKEKDKEEPCKEKEKDTDDKDRDDKHGDDKDRDGKQKDWEKQRL